MAPLVTPLRCMPPRSEFKPSAHHIIARYLAPKALRGYTTADPGHVAEGVDVFSSASPATLFFHPVSRTGHGKVWGYYYGDYPIDHGRAAPGGCWAQYGPVKSYVHGHGSRAMEAVAFRRRFAFHLECWGDDGSAVLYPTPWLMKEYRLNKGAAANRAAAARAQAPYRANMDCVVRKVFAKLPPPFGSADEEVNYPGGGEEAGYASDKGSRT